jgi:hypothetical protein
MRSLPAPELEPTPNTPPTTASLEWGAIADRAPQLASTMSRYLAQLSTTLAKTSVEAAENALRTLARFLADPDRPEPDGGLRSLADGTTGQ